VIRVADRWLWPLPSNWTPPPTRGDGSFGVVRKHDVHTGVDLYCEPGQEVRAVRDGWILLITAFTGASVGSPWWLDTSVVGVASRDGECVLYGEIQPEMLHAAVGARVACGQLLGRVQRVRREDDGRPTTMLHLERWGSRGDVLRCYDGDGWKTPNDWPIGVSRPVSLLDPTAKLCEALEEEVSRGRT